MQKTLGAFIARESLSSAQEFYSRVWALLVSGPSIVRPARCGSYEPLRQVRDVDLTSMLKSAYFASNGRSSRCSVWPPAFTHSRFYSVTILIYQKREAPDISRDVYQWLRDSVSADVAYMGTPTRLMFDANIDLHQILNTGAVERDIPFLRDRRAELDYFEELKLKE